MVNLFFFLKFESQLKRTRPDIIRQIDETLLRSISDAGGKIVQEHPVISVILDENTLGFWFDIFILVENIKKHIESSKEIFGFSLLIDKNSNDTTGQLCRFLAGGTGGIFFDIESAGNFLNYAIFESADEWITLMKAHKYGSERLCRIKELKIFTKAARNDLDIQRNVENIICNEKEKSVLILCPAFFLSRAGLYKYSKKQNDDFPVFTICFGSGIIGALTDAMSGKIRSVLSERLSDEIYSLHEFLSRERIRNEISLYTVGLAKRFFKLLLDCYTETASRKKRKAVLAIENINYADKTGASLIIDFLSIINKENLLIVGTSEAGIPYERLRRWENVFENRVTAGSGSEKQPVFQKLTTELWEIVYVISLLGRYFSPELFSRLLEEEGKNPLMITRALNILYMMGVVESSTEPWPVNHYYAEQSRRLPDRNAIRVKELVRRRLLSQVEKREINPCFKLIKIIADLDKTQGIDDLLLLKCLVSDIINGTGNGFELAVNNGKLEKIAGAEKAALIRYIFETFKALHSGNEKDIRLIFNRKPVNADSYPALNAQITVNLCGYNLGIRENTAAMEYAKEAVFIGQNNKTVCLPNAYRLFAIGCLAKQNINETIEYLGFALSEAEKNGHYLETGISAYYCAASYFLYGDIFSAIALTQKAIDQSLAAGRPSWADRSRFLKGRLEFETGHYREALAVFIKLLNEPYDIKSAVRDNMLYAWIYRCNVYLNNSEAVKPENTCYDAELFEVEAAYLCGDFTRAVKLAANIKNPFSNNDFLYIEQPDWRSGFAQCEHLFFGNGEIYDRLVCVFNSLAMSNLSVKDRKTAMDNMQKLLRDERLSEMDPWDSFYFYAWYRILEKSAADIVDMNTAVSIAFKRLQRRASRIENVEARRQYLNGSRWNNELCLAAREFKLI
jgi:hypothetical protein